MNGRDIGTVAWKELRELGDMLTGGSRAQFMVQGFVAIFFGVVSPIRYGANWFHNPAANAFYAFIGMMLIMQPIADVFAGERERHTLETLLATRLDDASILLGKLLGVLAPAWVVTAVLYGLAIVITNLVYRGHGLLLPPPASAAATLGAIVLVPGLIGAIGIFVSLNAPTVRKAAQVLSLIFMGLVFLPVVAIQTLPKEWGRRLVGALGEASPGRVLVIAGAVLLLLDVVLVWAALGHFRRGRLSLD